MKRVVWRAKPLEVGSLFRMPDPENEYTPEDRMFVVEKCQPWPLSTGSNPNSRGEKGYSVDIRPLDDTEKMVFEVMEG